MMKTVPKEKHFQKFLLNSVPVFMIVLAASNFSLASVSPPGGKTGSHHSIQVDKTLNNKKYKIKLYADDLNQALLFTVNGIDGQKYQLFPFDMESRLVTVASIRNKETSALNGISDGNYLYEVFMNDEQIESGRLTVK